MIRLGSNLSKSRVPLTVSLTHSMLLLQPRHHMIPRRFCSVFEKAAVSLLASCFLKRAAKSGKSPQSAKVSENAYGWKWVTNAVPVVPSCVIRLPKCDGEILQARIPLEKLAGMSLHRNNLVLVGTSGGHLEAMTIRDFVLFEEPQKPVKRMSQLIRYYPDSTSERPSAAVQSHRIEPQIGKKNSVGHVGCFMELVKHDCTPLLRSLWSKEVRGVYLQKYLFLVPLSFDVSRALEAIYKLSISDGGHLQRRMLSEGTQFPKSHVRHQYAEQVRKALGGSINHSQAHAITHALHDPVSLITGPPGTGKTTTIVNIIQEILKREAGPILVTSHTNHAVDVILENLLVSDPRLKAFRVVSEAKARLYPVEHHLSGSMFHLLESVCLSYYEKDIWRRLRHSARSRLVDAIDGKEERHTGLEAVSADEIDLLYKKREEIAWSVLGSCDVILCTNLSVCSKELATVSHFIKTIIIDESTQADMASAITAISPPNLSRVVLVGDNHQLGPVSGRQSLFDLLAGGRVEHTSFLDTQYRMHPHISEFPISHFYSNRLSNGPNTQSHTLPGLDPITFVDYGYAFQDSTSPAGSSFNRREAKLVSKIIHHLVHNAKLDPKTIVVVTPYASQRAVLQQALRRYGVSVSSIDSCQGQERDVVVLCMTRSNKKNRCGFIGNPRRLNVALTRAKKCLFVVGNSKCLTSSENTNLSALVEFFITKGRMVYYKDLFRR